MQSTPKHQEEAREIIGNVNNYADGHSGELSISAFGPLSQRIASALSAHNTQIREVLAGLRLRSDKDCWCHYVDDTRACGPACLAAKALWERVQS